MRLKEWIHVCEGGWQGKCSPSSWSLSQDMPELHLPQCPGGTGLPLLCPDTLWMLGEFKEPGWRALFLGWEGIRKWSKGCGTSQQLWLGLEP